MEMLIQKSLTLPCGSILKNRIAKSAMSENMAHDHAPGKEFVKAYSRWARGGTGLIISGNVMIDSRHLGEENNVVIEKGRDNLNELKAWANTSDNIWIQLNHPGKQTPKFLDKEPVAPSAIALKPPLNKLFNTPKELSEEQIQEIINRFSYAAQIVKECGFAGVQIHGAHGYLVSQFLSPRHNQRTDKWGQDKMLFVTEVYKAIREKVGAQFPVGIKMNSADFSKGGFTLEESTKVAKALSELGMDLIEISGGSYEKAAMMGVPIKESTKKREAYFIEYAKEIKKVVTCPLMVTGGFRTGEFMNECLSLGEVDMIGMGRPLCLDPDLSNKLLKGQKVESLVRPLTSGIKALDKIFPLEIIWYTMQIHRMGKGLDPEPNAGVYKSIFKNALSMGLQSIKRVRA